MLYTHSVIGQQFDAVLSEKKNLGAAELQVHVVAKLQQTVDKSLGPCVTVIGVSMATEMWK